MDSELERKRQKLREDGARLLKSDHFDALAVKRNASADDVKKAYVERVKAWHPDRVPAGLDDLKPLFNEVFARLDVARATLIDAPARLEYVGRLARGTMPSGQAEAIVELKKAEILLKKNDAAGAEAHAKRAAELDPKNVDAAALVVSIQVTKPGLDKDRLRGLTSELAGLLDRASPLPDGADRDRTLVRILSTRAEVHKRLERHADAYADFKRVAELDPKNIDAAREVRIFEMRRDKQSGAKPASASPAAEEGAISGLWKKLFKR